MRFPDSAPFGRECYWMLSIYECEHEMVHRWIMYISLVAHSVPIIFGGYLLWYRWHYLWPTLLADSGSGKIVRLPADGMIGCFLGACVTRLIQTILVLTDALPTFATRELFNDFSYWFGLWAVTVFLAGIIEAIPPVFVRGIGNSVCDNDPNMYGPQLTVWVPSRWIFVSCFTVLMLWGACLTAPFVYIGGHGADIGDWELFDWGLQWGYSMWSINLIILGAVACYYCISLLIIIRENLKLHKSSNANGQEMASVHHLQRTFLYNWLVCFGGTSICITWGFFHTQVMSRFWLSLIMEIPIHIFWWPGIVLVIMKRIYINSAAKAASIARQSTQHNSINTSSKMTINTARQSRYNAGLNEWDTLSDIEVNVKTSRRTSALMAAPNSNGKQWTSHSLMVENTGECTSNNRPKSMSASSVDWRISQHGNALMIPTAIIVNRANTLESRPEGISDVIITLKPSAELEDENTSTKSSTSPRDTISSLRSNSPHNLSGESNSHHLLLRGLADAVEKMAETANSTAATIRYSRADTPIPSNTSLIADQDEILSTEEKAAIEAAVRVQTSSADRREDTFSIDDYVQCNNSTASDSPDRVRDTLRLSINSDHLLMAHYGGLINSTPSQASIFQNEIANLPVNVIAPEPINTLQSLSVSSFINNSINSGTGHSLHSWRGDLADDYHNEDVYPTI